MTTKFTSIKEQNKLTQIQIRLLLRCTTKPSFTPNMRGLLLPVVRISHIVISYFYLIVKK